MAARRRVLADYKRPKQLIIQPELRRTPAGKADLGWARRVAQAGR
jgi:3-oxocholest-4-en-26-oate---CoA ligase